MISSNWRAVAECKSFEMPYLADYRWVSEFLTAGHFMMIVGYKLSDVSANKTIIYLP